MAGAIRAADTAAPLSSAASQTNAQQILDGWRASAVDAGVTDLARASLTPQYQKAIQAAGERIGAELSDEQLESVVADVDDRLLGGARDKVFASLKNDPSAKARLVSDAVADLRARAPKLRNPFAPIAAGDANARAKERVLWESPALMVLVDRFADTPHALVIPKAPALLPVDLPPATLDELGRVGKAVSQAFVAVAKTKPSELFVNPPQLVTLGQLHLHVIPPMRPLRESMENKFWAKLSGALSKTLGASTPASAA